jgi:hypothetical protein
MIYFLKFIYQEISIFETIWTASIRLINKHFIFCLIQKMCFSGSRRLPRVTADNLPNGGPLRHQFKARARIPDLIFQRSSSTKSSEKVSSCPLNLDGKKEKTFILFNHSECQLFREWRQILAS